MKVLLINPDSPFLVDSRTFPPLGLLYLGAALEQAGHEAVFADCAFDDLITDHDGIDLIAVMCLTPHYPHLMRLLDAARKQIPEAPIVVGGPHFSTVPEDYKKVGADAICVGDGEEVIVHWADEMEHGQMPQGQQSSQGGIVDVDRVPIPARYLTDVHRYQYFIGGHRATTLMTQRGCPYDCSFCCHFQGYRTMRLRSFDNIDLELSILKTQGFEAVMIYDDEVNIVHKRTLGLCEVLKSSGMKWRAFIKANLFNEEQAKAFADSGCWELCTGVESGSDAVLKIIRKKATVEDNTRSRQLCKDYGIRFKAFTMVGHPGETEETAEATKRWLIDNAPDEFNVSLYTPYIGTPVTDHPEKFDVKFNLDYHKEEFFYRGKPTDYSPNASTSSLSAERLVQLRDEIENEVRDKLELPKQGTPEVWYATARSAD